MLEIILLLKRYFIENKLIYTFEGKTTTNPIFIFFSINS